MSRKSTKENKIEKIENGTTLPQPEDVVPDFARIEDRLGKNSVSMGKNLC